LITLYIITATATASTTITTTANYNDFDDENYDDDDDDDDDNGDFLRLTTTTTGFSCLSRPKFEKTLVSIGQPQLSLNRLGARDKTAQGHTEESGQIYT
jgi:hypothetical protein